VAFQTITEDSSNGVLPQATSVLLTPTPQVDVARALPTLEDDPGGEQWQSLPSSLASACHISDSQSWGQTLCEGIPSWQQQTAHSVTGWNQVAQE
jgi:hypothetical protein